MTFEIFFPIFLGILFSLIGFLLVSLFKTATTSAIKSIDEMRGAVNDMQKSVEELNVTVRIEMTKSEALKKEMDRHSELICQMVTRIETIELNQAANKCNVKCK